MGVFEEAKGKLKQAIGELEVVISLPQPPTAERLAEPALPDPAGSEPQVKGLAQCEP